jgi:hypothetical protein
VRADVARKLRKRFGSIKIASGKAAGKAGKRTNLKLKLTRKARRGLRGRRSLPFTLKGVASDGAQNKRTLSKKATLKRKR